MLPGNSGGPGHARKQGRPLSGIAGPNQGFTHQDRVDPSAAQGFHLVPPGDAALGNQDHLVGHIGQEVHRDLEVRTEAP